MKNREKTTTETRRFLITDKSWINYWAQTGIGLSANIDGPYNFSLNNRPNTTMNTFLCILNMPLNSDRPAPQWAIWYNLRVHLA